MIKLDLAKESRVRSPIVETEPGSDGGESGGESLFEAMKGALRRTDRADLTGFGFFVVKPRKRVQEALSLLEAIFESSSDAIIGVTLDGKIITWNRGAELIFGYEAREISGRQLSALAPEGRGAEVMDTLARLKHGVKSVELEASAVTRDGRHLILELTVSAITDKRGRAAAASLVARDVTERRRAEQELRKSEEWFRALVEESADLIAVLARDGTIRSVNPSLRRLLGYPLGQVAGNSPLEWIHPDDLGAVAEAAQKFIQFETGGPTCLRVRHSDGSWRAIEAVARNLVDDDEAGSVIINARDITGRVQAEEQLRIAYGRTERMDAVEKLSGVIARDLDNLLTAICGYTGLIIDQVSWNGFQQDRLLEDAQHVKRAADDAAALSERLLVFGQRQLLRPRLLDINSVIASLDSTIRRLLGEDIAVVTMLDREAGRVKADQKQIERAIVNISVNAREAMPHGGTLTIETTNVEMAADSANPPGQIGSGRYVVLSIRDSGRGMDPETQSHIFEPFFTTKEGDSHRGMGLSIAHGIIKQSEGYISVCSELGVGTSFRICLPRADVPTEVSVAKPESEELPRGTETVLLLLHDEAVRGLAREILTTSGYAVLEARDATEAHQLCQSDLGAIDLLVADAASSSAGAHEIATRLLTLRPDMKVLFTCGYIDDAAQQGTIEGWPLLEKPFTPAALARKTREVLDESRRVQAQTA